MTRKSRRSTEPGAGTFGIGVLRPKYVENLGTLWRSAHALGASFLFTIQDRFPPEARRDPVAADPALGRPEDTTRSWEKLPYLTFPSVEALREAMPLHTLVGVEQTEGAVDLSVFDHPAQAIYLLGSEIDGVTPPALRACDRLLQIPTQGSLNVAVAGSIVLYDRVGRGITAGDRSS
jgi:tRNA G18 (ribose-2'-O)-methylase SpoU